MNKQNEQESISIVTKMYSELSELTESDIVNYLPIQYIPHGEIIHTVEKIDILDVYDFDKIL